MNLLFISHEASRSGAPILLLSFLRWLAQTSDIRFEILLLSDGPLRGEFARLAPTYTTDEISGRYTPLGRALQRALDRNENFWMEKTCRTLLARTHYDGIYGNTVLSLPWLLRMEQLGNVPGICHLHEMAWVIGEFFPAAYVTEAIPRLHAVIACSAPVATDLRDQYSIDAAKIFITNSFIESDVVIEEAPDSVRRSLAIPENALVVCGVGRAEMRKGVDLAVRLLERVVKCAPDRDVRFIWVGASSHDALLSICRHDLRKLGLADKFTFVEHTPRPNDYINASDIFAMTSREDPMPLVALAAARLGKPIVAFADAGGIAELVGDDCGYRVPYLDVDAMADAVLRIADQPEESGRRALALQKKVRAQNTLDVIGVTLRGVIERTFKPAGG